MNNKKYHYFYKITNKINNHFYYGIHNTNNLNDGYMGSGKRLRIAYNKYGIENFEKEILKYFNTAKEAFEYEAEIVTENLVKDNNCYNLNIGGDGGWEYINSNLITVKDKNNNIFCVDKDDPRYINGELVHFHKDIMIVKDNNGNTISINKNNNNNQNFVGVTKGYVTVKDNNGNIFNVPKNDSRYLSGELKYIWVGKKHSEETKRKISETKKKNKLSLGVNNSQYGTCWIHNLIEKKSIIIKKEELDNYIKLGWIKGRKMKF